ncbi:molecular chaperone htpG [Candidatus Kinetoplastibacterium blastocrithidii TCC012E]|uniref:Molecular chaperone HtpG n=2 Tax=cellular organisms TaxID=131567 RepID=S9U4M8_9TRYP|nr:molecular chaperone HtpG [Candidatus Kinetoplastibacterium blastocrithidii]AFZ83434.1 molecular chaperone HtpG [Candidatus Kinetoplastibacterium blastocrithidii (ex Strigomonas culicis)]AGF49530.1 molecular chaperone htpG [Candidatus Kinetoplastibacterium blastocrithidii TCC012E]EPY20734.1 molecular chaperone HtpG [Strigomonas culicis]EPY25732.1 molecular chaperone HtpG [Strigomonas culicis]|eukprot:EPY20734.1 molecular chaperone HtpG [Strigomonas culicis]
MSKVKNQEPETMSFQAEVKQLLHLMIHSLYSNKEIFLRELISNASDACDKLRFEAIDKPYLLGDTPDLSIKVFYDSDLRTISIIDNGIGMSSKEVVDNLGTIAKSGTKDFIKNLSGDQQKDACLIGQFGVGFYSAFIVSDKVKVISRRADLPIDQAVCWTSDGLGEFTVVNLEREDRGTEIILHIRNDFSDLLSGWKLREIIRKYSDHISLPILMCKEEWDEKVGKQIKTNDLESVNQSNALWTRQKSEITEEQYKEFYKLVFHDFEDPLIWTHNKIEGSNEYTQLFYIPKHSQFDIWDREKSNSIKLYVRRVFIMDDSDQLLPRYLRFIRGIIDSADIDLNVSREILQESREVNSIRDSSVKRILNLLDDISSKDNDKYLIFWNQFGQILKEGIGEDFSNQERIAKLLRFSSTHNNDKDQKISLNDYISRLKPNQNNIYYITSDSFENAISSPHLEIFRKKGIEVLLLSDRIDEWMLSSLRSFENKSLVSIAKDNLNSEDITDVEERKDLTSSSESLKPMIDRLYKSLSKRVKEVRVSSRLVDSPACLVVNQNELSPHLVRMLRAAGQNSPDSKPILEVNANHKFLKKLEDMGDNDFDSWANLLLDQAILTSGGQLPEPNIFVNRLNNILLDN